MQNTCKIQSYLLVSLISFEEFVRGSKEDRVSVVEDKRDLKLIFSRVELKHLKLTLAYVGFQIILHQANVGFSHYYAQIDGLYFIVLNQSYFLKGFS